MEEAMKRYSVIVAVVVLSVLLAVPSTARPPVEPKANPYQELTEKTLLNGLNCENCGVRASAAFMAGDLKIQSAVIPLMRVLKDSENETTRVIAALSLCRIGDARGVFAVKRAARFDSSERVRMACGWYYNEFVKAGTFEFAPVERAGSEQIVKR
jgi:hypothetical protein